MPVCRHTTVLEWHTEFAENLPKFGRIRASSYEFVQNFRKTSEYFVRIPPNRSEFVVQKRINISGFLEIPNSSFSSAFFPNSSEFLSKSRFGIFSQISQNFARILIVIKIDSLQVYFIFLIKFCK